MTAYVNIVDPGKVGITAPEAAKLLAMKSRNVKTVKEHLDEGTEANAGAMLEKFYINYGHKSIGDCGTTIVDTANVSMLAALAIEDHGLFNGQENSTRYIQFDNATFYTDPKWSDRATELTEKWFDLYRRVFDIMVKHTTETATKPEDISDAKWEKAITCYAFDVARGWLPASTHTGVGWSTTLSNARHHLETKLHVHPLKEIRDLAQGIQEELAKEYPETFTKRMSKEKRDFYAVASLANNYEAESNSAAGYNRELNTASGLTYISESYSMLAVGDVTEVTAYDALLDMRPKGAHLPPVMKELGQLRIRAVVDLGGFRDIHRHRDGVVTIPHVSPVSGIHTWYTEQLPEECFDEIVSESKAILKEVEKDKEVLFGENHHYDQQYLCPLGICVETSLIWNLPQITYFCELRAGKDTHATVREIAHGIGEKLNTLYPPLNLRLDDTEQLFSVNRAEQDIIEK